MLYNNYLGVEGLGYIPHGQWADPELIYKGRVFNYWDVFDRLFDEFLEENPGYDDSEAEELFDQYLIDNPFKLEDLLLDFVAASPPEFTVVHSSLAVYFDVSNNTTGIYSDIKSFDFEPKKYSNITELFDDIDEYVSRSGYTIGSNPSYSYYKDSGKIELEVYNYNGNLVTDRDLSEYLSNRDPLDLVVFEGFIETVAGSVIDESDFDLVGISNIQDSE